MAHREDAYELISRSEIGLLFITEEEKLEAADLLQPMLDNIHSGMGRTWYENNPDFDAFSEYTGLTANDSMFWEMFREWYGG
jgi:hypothetical protein